jgi:hypothetical protein
MGFGDVQKKRFPNYSACEHLLGRAPDVVFRTTVVPELIDGAKASQHFHHSRIVLPLVWVTI